MVFADIFFLKYSRQMYHPAAKFSLQFFRLHISAWYIRNDAKLYKIRRANTS